MGGGAVVFDEASKRRPLGSDLPRAMTRLWASRAFIRPGLTPHMQASKQRRHEAASAMHLLCKLVACWLQSAFILGTRDGKSPDIMPAVSAHLLTGLC